jgi:transposase
MQDRELYRQILGIEAPWFVERVELKLAEGGVHLHLDHHEVMNWPRPECGAECRLYDHQPERQWRHLTPVSTSGLLKKARRQRFLPSRTVR